MVLGRRTFGVDDYASNSFEPLKIVPIRGEFLFSTANAAIVPIMAQQFVSIRCHKLVHPPTGVDLLFGDHLTNFNGLIHLTYEASTDPGKWPEVVRALALVLSGEKAMLFTPCASPQNGGLAWSWQIDKQDLDLWAQKYIHLDIWTQSLRRKGLVQPGSVYTDQDLLPENEFHSSLLYREFLSRVGIGRVCGAVLSADLPGQPFINLSVYRKPDAPAFNANERHIMGQFLPHLTRALMLMMRLDFNRQRLQSLCVAFDDLSVGVVLLNQRQEMVFANTAARSIFDRGDGLYLHNRRLMSRHVCKAYGTHLDAWLAQWCADPEMQSNTLEIQRSPGQLGYILKCRPLDFTGGFCGTDAARHMVLITDPDRGIWPSPEALRQKLGLTAAEARVALLLAQGATYRSLAEQIGVAEETVRSHVKSIYSKTKINQKAKLTQTIMSLVHAI